MDRIPRRNIEGVQKFAFCIDPVERGVFAVKEIKKHRQIMGFEKGKVEGYDTGFQIFLGGLLKMKTDLGGEGPVLLLIDKGKVEVLICFREPSSDDFPVTHEGLSLP
jgi:hypothetical protein